MRFVNDDAIVFREQRIALRLRKQNAIRHQLDISLRAAAVVEANRATDFATPIHI